MSSLEHDDDLAPTETQGYKVPEKKSLAEYAEIDKEDESLAKWKASLGIGATAGASSDGPKVQMVSLSLVSDSRPEPIVLDLTDVHNFKSIAPVTLKEGAEYAVELKFTIQNEVVTGLRYIQVVKRSGLKVDKLDSMIGSYGPSADAYTKRFITEDVPSGMLARSGTYNVRSVIRDDDGAVYADFAWQFKIAKEW